MATTSIHIRPCILSHSQKHNNRIITPDYVNKNLIKNNEKLVFVENLNERLEEIKSLYEEKVKQRLHKKMTPIREGVIVVDENTTIQDLRNFGNGCYKRWGIEPLQIYLHKDEGHFDDNGEWKPNYHAHIIFDWQDKNTGKSIKLSKQDMAEMQTLLADTLNMQRGESSDKKYVDHIVFKIEKEKEKLNTLKMQHKAISDTLEEKTRKVKDIEENALKKLKEAENIKQESLSNIFLALEKNKIAKDLNKAREQHSAVFNAIAKTKRIIEEAKEVEEKYKIYLKQIEDKKVELQKEIVKQEDIVSKNKNLIINQLIECSQIKSEIQELKEEKENIILDEPDDIDNEQYRYKLFERLFQAFEKLGDKKMMNVIVAAHKLFLSVASAFRIYDGYKVSKDDKVYWWSDKHNDVVQTQKQEQTQNKKWKFGW